ncbi:MAG: hypothetical protein ACW99J_19120 [Candidatus Thorarchaeota archaeon]
MKEEKHWEAYVFYLCLKKEEACSDIVYRYGDQETPECSGCPFAEESKEETK